MFSYIGGKSRIGKWIKDYIPNDIETYVEPFSGAFWVYFNMPLDAFPNLKTIVYNDFNPLNANLFACVKKHQEFHEYIKDIPSQEKDRFIEYQKNAFSKEFTLDPENPDFELGLQYIYVVTQVFSGSKPETSSFIDLKGKYRSKFDTFKDKLVKPKYIPYYEKITHIQNLDFEECINMWDSPKTYFYLDPPYWSSENYYSNHSFSKLDHERLADALSTIDGEFSLSYYHFEQLDEWYPMDTYKWEQRLFAKSAGASKGKSQSMGTELLIMNY